MDFIRARPPNMFLMCVSKVAHAMTRFTHECTAIEIKVGRNMKIAVEVDLPAGEEKLSLYDMAVYSAVQSLFVAGNEAFTIPMVCRVMCGKQSATNLSDKIKHEVSESIRKLRTTHININAKAQQKKYKLPQAVYTGPLLDLVPMTACNDCGQACLHYKFSKAPVLYEYSFAIKHIFSYPMEAVETSRINNTHNAILVRYCLLRRVAIILRSGRNAKILYETLFEEAGCADACKRSKVLRSKQRRLIRCVLDELVTAGIIVSYVEQKKYHSFASVIIVTGEKRISDASMLFT